MYSDIISRVEHLLEISRRQQALSQAEEMLLVDHFSTLYRRIPHDIIEHDVPHLLREFKEYCNETFMYWIDAKDVVHSLSLAHFFSLPEHPEHLIKSFSAHVQQMNRPGQLLYNHLTQIHHAACRTKAL